MVCAGGQMSAALLSAAVEGDYGDTTVYGAVTFREADPTTGDFDYTVHVRLCLGACCCWCLAADNCR